MIRALLLLITIFSLTNLYAQKGENTYEFLNLPNSARVGALGGANISLDDNDINIAYNNPALLDSLMDNHIAVNYINYMGDINFGYASYVKNFEHVGTFGLGVQYINYGEFDYADETGVFSGATFGAQETALNIQYGRPLYKNWHIGMNLKQIFSNHEQYNSYGIVADAGLQYALPNAGFSGGLVFRNMGTQITTYTDNNFEEMPFEVMLGVSQKLLHAPLRFSVTARHLQQWDLTYSTDTESSDSSTDTESDEPNFGDKLLRHMVVGVEFLPFKNFYVAAGYNAMRRYELAVSDNKSTVGWSWGFGVKVYKFQISYGSARYHLAGTSNHFSITTNLSAF